MDQNGDQELSDYDSNSLKKSKDSQNSPNFKIPNLDMLGTGNVNNMTKDSVIKMS